MKFIKQIPITLSAMILFLAGTVTGVAAGDKDLTMFAAASTTNAVKEIVELYKAQGLGNIKTSFASSSTLAKQIANGAPADIYLSANKKWMDYLEQKKVIQSATRFNLLGNRIAFIVPNKSDIQKIKITQDLDILSILGRDGRLAMGDPAHVPAGIYGKQALETLGLWRRITRRIAPMKDVRAALVMVERGETPLGLVYTTDAAVSKKVHIAGVFPAESHPEIVYPVAVVSKENLKAGTSFLIFLKSGAARNIFKKHGFEIK